LPERASCFILLAFPGLDEQGTEKEVDVRAIKDNFYTQIYLMYFNRRVKIYLYFFPDVKSGIKGDSRYCERKRSRIGAYLNHRDILIFPGDFRYAFGDVFAIITTPRYSPHIIPWNQDYVPVHKAQYLFPLRWKFTSSSRVALYTGLFKPGSGMA